MNVQGGSGPGASPFLGREAGAGGLVASAEEVVRATMKHLEPGGPHMEIDHGVGYPYAYPSFIGTCSPSISPHIYSCLGRGTFHGRTAHLQGHSHSTQAGCRPPHPSQRGTRSPPGLSSFRGPHRPPEGTQGGGGVRQASEGRGALSAIKGGHTKRRIEGAGASALDSMVRIMYQCR